MKWMIKYFISRQMTVILLSSIPCLVFHIIVMYMYFYHYDIIRIYLFYKYNYFKYMYDRYEMHGFFFLLFFCTMKTGLFLYPYIIAYTFIVLIFITHMLCRGMLYDNFILGVTGSTNMQLTLRYVLKCLKSSQKTFFNMKFPLRNSTSYTAYSSNNVMHDVECDRNIK